MNIQNFAKTAQFAIKAHTPEILTGTGVAAIAAGTILTARATLKAPAKLAEHRDVRDKIEQAWEMHEKGDLPDEEYNKKDYIQDKTVCYRNVTVEFLKLYAAPVSLTVAGIGCILLSHKILRNREASALAAAATISSMFDKYRNNVKEDLGADADHAFMTGRKVKIDKEGKIKVGKPQEGKAAMIEVLYDEVSAPSTWESAKGMNYIRLNAVQNILNDRLKMSGSVFLNEVFDELGLPRTPEGAIMGWSRKVNENSFIDFGFGNTDIPAVMDFVNGDEPSVWLQFNVDGLIWDRL